MLRVSVFSCILIFGLILQGCGGGGGSNATPPPSDPPRTPIGGAPMSVESNIQSAESFVLDGNSAGEAIVVWTQVTSALERELWANVYKPASGWIGEEKISDAVTLLSLYAVIDESGDAVILWSQVGGGIWSASIVDDTLTMASQLEADAITPYLAEDPSSTATAVAVWTDSQRNNLYTSSFQGDAGWGMPGTIDKALDGEVVSPDAYNPRVGADVAGNLYVTWWAAGGFRDNIFFTSGGWAGVGEISDTNTRSATLTVGTSGHAVLVWQEALGGGMTGIRASTYESAAWSVADDRHTFSGLLLNGITALVDSAGQTTLTWDEISGAGGTTAQIRSLGYSSTSGWDSSAKDVPGQIEALEVSVLDTNNNGDIVAAWANNDGISASIYLPTITMWSSSLLVVSENAELPKFNLTDNYALVVWLQADGDVKNVWSAVWHIP